MAFADVLADAKRLGYAEADPSADVDGHDAAAKCAILASIAFNARVVASDVFREGIAGVTTEDIEFARRLGYVVKLLAIAEMGEDERIAVRVHPAMIPAAHPLASVRDAYNAVFVEGPNVGELMFYGRGAGGDADRDRGGRRPRERRAEPARRCPRRRVHVLPRADDPPDGGDDRAVLHPAAGRGSPRRARRDRERVRRAARSRSRACGRRGPATDAQLVFITHRAREGAFQEAVAELRGLAGRRGGSERPARRGRGVAHGRALARRDRGVPRPAAGRRGDAGRHALRGRHAARPLGAAVASRPGARSG